MGQLTELAKEVRAVVGAGVPASCSVVHCAFQTCLIKSFCFKMEGCFAHTTLWFIGSDNTQLWMGILVIWNTCYPKARWACLPRAQQLVSMCRIMLSKEGIYSRTLAFMWERGFLSYSRPCPQPQVTQKMGWNRYSKVACCSKIQGFLASLLPGVRRTKKGWLREVCYTLWYFSSHQKNFL